jgi:hypothetical protein
MLQEYESKSQDALRRFLAVKNRLPAWDGLAPEGKARALQAARARYDAEIEEVMAEALAAIENEAESLAEAEEKHARTRWASMREALGDVAAALVFTQKVQTLSLPALAELYTEADEWGKTIIGQLVEEPPAMNDRGELNLPALLAYREITDGETRRFDGGEELNTRKRTLSDLERRLVELDPIGHARAQSDALGVDVEKQLLERDTDLSTTEAGAADNFIRESQTVN